MIKLNMNTIRAPEEELDICGFKCMPGHVDMEEGIKRVENVNICMCVN